MNGILKQFIVEISPNCQDENGKNSVYAIFRIVLATMFFMHGLQKIFGLSGGIDGLGGSVTIYSLFWFAGLIEIIVGGFVFVGFYTRLAALVGAVEMLAALFIAHFPNGINPLLNGGELALVYMVSFLVMLRYGGGKFSLENKLFGREQF